MQINKKYFICHFSTNRTVYLVSPYRPGNYYNGYIYKDLKAVYIESICILYEKG